MKHFHIILLIPILMIIGLKADIIEKKYLFSDYNLAEKNSYHIISLKNTCLTGVPGEPILPYKSVAVLLPPGHVAVSIKIIGESEKTISGDYLLMPQQYSHPLASNSPDLIEKNRRIYNSKEFYPKVSHGYLTTEFLNGFSFALSTFTPVRYIPASGKLSYYSEVKVQIETMPDNRAETALLNFSSSINQLNRIKKLAQNPEMISSYPDQQELLNSDYQMLIITANQFEYNFGVLKELYLIRGIITKIITTDSIYSAVTGQDNQEKIRNFIIQEYQNYGIEYVLLGGDVEYVPYRGFYCTVQSSIVYEDYDIPADLYYSSLDGTWNDDGDNKWGEIGEDDLLPEVSVGRMSVSNQTELNNMLNKVINYQNNPVLGELRDPLMVGEHLWSNPLTWGGDYMDLLIGLRNDNGYTTDGIPSDHNIEKLYDRDLGYWSGSTLISKINQGKSFVHHSGHASYSYSMRLDMSDITDFNFSQANGINHNYTLVYSHGCNSGGFDHSDCIAEKMVSIAHFAVAFVGNSRYGWFNEGQTEGPSQHLHREFVDALYNDQLFRIGTTHLDSKIMTAPWVTAPGQWEEGAQRWCFYCCNVLGDPAMGIWTDEPINIQASYQNTIQPGTSVLNVLVTSVSEPLRGMTCVVMKDSVLHGVGVTDSSGQAEINLQPPITQLGNADLIISGYNCLPTAFPVVVTSLDGEPVNSLPETDALVGNYPNPFNPYTTIAYQLKEKSNVRIVIFNTTAQKIKTLVRGNQLPGFYEVVWDGTNDQGIIVSNGLYFYKMDTGKYSSVKKMIFLK